MGGGLVKDLVLDVNGQHIPIANLHILEDYEGDVIVGLDDLINWMAVIDMAGTHPILRCRYGEFAMGRLSEEDNKVYEERGLGSLIDQVGILTIERPLDN